MDAATFRQDFPEFANVSDYPDAQVNLWLMTGAMLLPADRWDELLNIGLELYTAHHLALGRRDQAASDAGGVPGTVNGPQTAKSVDKVSASYDTGAVTLDSAGFWNLTTYGIRLLGLSRMVGAGGIQL